MSLLTPRSEPSRSPATGRAVFGRAGALIAALALVACGGDGPRATPTPDRPPVLAIVTPTPGTPTPRTPTPPAGQQRYVVREGDTLSSIAARFSVSQEAIQRANGIPDPNNLLVGQELVIPPPEP